MSLSLSLFPEMPFKAFARGSFQSIIQRVKMEMSSELVEAEQRASTYIQTQGPQTYQALQVALREVCLLRTKATNVGLLHQTQHILNKGKRQDTCRPGWPRNNLCLSLSPALLTLMERC